MAAANGSASPRTSPRTSPEVRSGDRDNLGWQDLSAGSKTVQNGLALPSAVEFCPMAAP